MRATLLLVFLVGLVALVACQGDPASVQERAAKHTMADRGHAMAALSAGLDDAYGWLKDHPSDQAGALAAAKAQIGHDYTADETDAFRLHVGNGEYVLYMPPSGAALTSVWLGRTENHLITDPAGLSPEARAKAGIK